MTHDNQSTPITPDGLRGLGMEMNFFRNAWRTRAGSHEVTVWHPGSEVILDREFIGTAPDIETVGRLIDLLRRMNGGE